jgi:hypothetical protein
MGVERQVLNEWQHWQRTGWEEGSWVVLCGTLCWPQTFNRGAVMYRMGWGAELAAQGSQDVLRLC